MKDIKIIISFLVLSFNCNAQLVKLKGKVVDPHFNPITNVIVTFSDSIILSKSDYEGKFEIEFAETIKVFQIHGLNMESKNISVSKYCSHLDIIMLYAGTYDFTSSRKVDRLRRKEFEKLAGLYREAFRLGVFANEEPCFIESFVPIRHRLEEIRKARKKRT